MIGKAHENASFLKERDRIKLLECDVSTTYDKEKKVEYVNYKVFDFEMADGSKPFAANQKAAKPTAKRTAFEEEGENNEDDLPF